MVVGVKVFIDRRAPEAEIRAQVNHLAAELEQGDGELGGGRRAAKPETRSAPVWPGVRPRLTEAQPAGARMMGEFREDLCQRLPGRIGGR